MESPEIIGTVLVDVRQNTDDRIPRGKRVDVTAMHFAMESSCHPKRNALADSNADKSIM